jgi:hypothetical protein
MGRVHPRIVAAVEAVNWRRDARDVFLVIRPGAVENERALISLLFVVNQNDWPPPQQKPQTNAKKRSTSLAHLNHDRVTTQTQHQGVLPTVVSPEAI